MRAITLSEANDIIAGTFAAASKREAHALAAIVLDAGGRVKAFQKQDGASLLRFEIAYGKAFAALALNRSSRQVLKKAKEKPAFMQSLVELSDGPLFLEAGGQLIRDDTGEIVGALGVTGDVNEIDDLCAIDGIHAGGLRADRDFTGAIARRLNIKTDPPLKDPAQAQGPQLSRHGRCRAQARAEREHLPHICTRLAAYCVRTSGSGHRPGSARKLPHIRLVPALS